jgi:hypothetical protein
MFLASSLLLALPAQAFDMGNMMNPSKWVGGDKDRDRYDDDYYDYGPPPGYGGYGMPGYGGYGAPGYGGYGMPGYGGYGAPGYGGYGGGPGYGGYGAPVYGGGPASQGLQAYDYATPGAPSSGSSYTGPSYGGNYTGPSDSSHYGPGVISEDQLEIQRLKDRIRKLEQADKPQPNVWGN